jgi:hypothetical protein
MTSQYRHRRADSPDIPFTNPLEPGEIAVNTGNRQIAVGDAASGSIGTPLPLLAVRIFDTRSKYAINDLVAHSGSILVALVAITPGAFNPTQWKNITADTDLTPYLPKAGGTMTGPITLAANAAAAMQAVPLQQLSSSIAAIPPPPPPLYISDTAPVGAPDNSMWWNSNTGILYVRFHDIDSTAWVQAVALPGGDLSGLVKRAGDTMSGPLALAGNAVSALQAVPKQQLDTVAATAKDALAYSGMQVNGAMEVSQELGLTVTSGLAGNLIDSWKFYTTSTQTARVQCASEVPSIPLPGFQRNIYAYTTVAQPALTADELVILYTPIESYRTSRLGWGTAQAQPVTIAFWSCHTKPGLYCVNASVNTINKSYVSTYTQAAANVWQYNVITVQGMTTDTHPVGNVQGLSLDFTMMAGPTFITPTPNTWVVGNFKATTGQVNCCDAVSGTMRLAGVVVLPGIEAPSAARSALIMRPYDQELLTCQRYWQKSYPYAIAPGATGANPGAVIIQVPANPTPIGNNLPYGGVRLAMRMRSAPTVLIYSANGTQGAISDNSGSNLAAGSGSTFAVGDTGFGMVNNSGGTININAAAYFQYTADARL